MTQKTTKQIDQSFKSHPSFPQLELRSTYNSKQAYKAHSHSEFSIGAIERGTTQIQYAGKSHLANEGQLVLIEPHKVHSCNPYGGQQRSYQMLYIDNQWYQNKLTSLYGKNAVLANCNEVVITDPVLFQQYMDLVTIFKNSPPCPDSISSSSFNQSLLDNMMLSILSRFYSVGSLEKEEHLISSSIRQLLSEDLSKPLVLDELAEKFSCRKETLVRIFKRDVGFPPNAFLNNLRIEKAKTLLKKGKDIAAIAVDIGFVDQSHFHKTFVTHTASTPGQYQQSFLRQDQE